MNLPQLPKTNLVDQDGKLTIPWLRFFSKLVADINENLSDDGYKIPIISKSVDELKQTGIKNKSTFFYLDDVVASNDQLIVNINGTLKKITVTDL